MDENIYNNDTVSQNMRKTLELIIEQDYPQGAGCVKIHKWALANIADYALAYMNEYRKKKGIKKVLQSINL